ncbi:MAG: AzlC family ABC transporter permease [Clostridia bacterium]|nr:AzlC family ABC transporter permease [Clostridia bacterium]
MRDAFPVFLGYLAVSFTFGIAARNSDLTVFQATLMSLLNLTSAGQFASLGIIAASASYFEMAATQLIINLRYSLMSSTLSQKVDTKLPFFHRAIMSFGVTDEIFALGAGVHDTLSPFYCYGMMASAIPGWTLGTFFGVVLGNILPDRLLSALSVALYGMFIAIVIPPSRRNKVVAGVVALSMLASALFTYLPVVSQISSGFRIIILTVVISAVVALLFPVEDKEDENA